MVWNSSTTFARQRACVRPAVAPWLALCRRQDGSALGGWWLIVPVAKMPASSSSARADASGREARDDNAVAASYFHLLCLSYNNAAHLDLHRPGCANRDVPAPGKFIFLPDQGATVFRTPTPAFSTLSVRRRQSVLPTNNAPKAPPEAQSSAQSREEKIAGLRRVLKKHVAQAENVEFVDEPEGVEVRFASLHVGLGGQRLPRSVLCGAVHDQSRDAALASRRPLAVQICRGCRTAHSPTDVHGIACVRVQHASRVPRRCAPRSSRAQARGSSSRGRSEEGRCSARTTAPKSRSSRCCARTTRTTWWAGSGACVADQNI